MLDGPSSTGDRTVDGFAGSDPKHPVPEPLPERAPQQEAAPEAAPLGLATLDLDFRYLSVNPVFARMHGLQPEDFAGHTIEEALPTLAPLMRAHLERCVLRGESVANEIAPEPGAGEAARVLLLTSSPVLDAAGTITGISSGLLDITERKRAEAALRESEEKYRHVVELNPHIPWTCTPDGSVVELSPRWTVLTGLPPGPVRGEAWLRAIHPGDRPATIEAWRTSMRTGCPFDVEYRVRSAAGSWLWLRVRAAAHRSEGGAILQWYGILEDINERKQMDAALREKTRKLELATEELAMQVREDHLTGLANRRHFDDMLVRELLLSFRSRAPLVLMMIDVDRFKTFNDSYGHVAGDECLRKIGGMLRQITRQPADTVARYGGEEFAVILPNTHWAGAMVVANRAIEGARALGIAHSANPRGVVTISAGVAQLNLEERSGLPAPALASALVVEADAALYAAKHGGRDRAVCAHVLPPG